METKPKEAKILKPKKEGTRRPKRKGSVKLRWDGAMNCHMSAPYASQLESRMMGLRKKTHNMLPKPIISDIYKDRAK